MASSTGRKKHVLVVSDNETMLTFFIELIKEMPDVVTDTTFAFACAPWDEALKDKKIGVYTVGTVNVKKEYEDIIKTYDLVISVHCKQLFPAALAEGVTCINIHPGLNPYNRGWFPQVFSIINGLPLGATLHEIDADIDHGAIIDQEKVDVESWDTSLDAYNKVLKAEQVIVRRSLESILDGTYKKKSPAEEGNLNLKKDFDALCELNLSKEATYGEVINKLRALSHAPYKNAYYRDEKTGKKVYVSVQFEVKND